MQYSLSAVEKLIGFFILLVLVLLGAFFIFNIKEGKLFARRMTLFSVTDKGYGLVKGTNIKVNGIIAGTITDIKLNRDNTVVITMNISRPFAENIHKNAVAEIIEPLALGNPEINILPGSLDQPLVVAGDFIEARLSESLTAKLTSSFNEVEATISEIHKTVEKIGRMTENLESITRKIDRGEGSLGKMVNDTDLYDSAKEAVDSTRSIVEGIKSTKIYVGGETNYYAHQDVSISGIHLKIVPRESRYFWVGGKIFYPASDSKITLAADEPDYKIMPELLIAQKIFDNRLTLRGGLLEGRLGGGLDYVPFPGKSASLQPKQDGPADQSSSSRLGRDSTVATSADWKENILLTIEGRDVFDDDDFNEQIDDFLLRAKVKIKFFKYFNLEVGGDNLLHDPAWLVGIGFEYLDEDISKIVGLIGAGK
ncbi:MAG: MlaD family protein [Planctomycetota bacterium]